MKIARKLQFAAALCTVSILGIASASADAVSDAKDFVAKLSAPNAPWNGPTTGPKALPGKTIIYVSTDQRNGGARGAGEGVKAAAERIGWMEKLDQMPAFERYPG